MNSYCDFDYYISDVYWSYRGTSRSPRYWSCRGFRADQDTAHSATSAPKPTKPPKPPRPPAPATWLRPQFVRRVP